MKTASGPATFHAVVHGAVFGCRVVVRYKKRGVDQRKRFTARGQLLRRDDRTVVVRTVVMHPDVPGRPTPPDTYVDVTIEIAQIVEWRAS